MAKEGMETQRGQATSPKSRGWREVVTSGPQVTVRSGGPPCPCPDFPASPDPSDRMGPA